jgi:polysaccharide deacetylase family protein (PEP-CTERM system associated)
MSNAESRLRLTHAAFAAAPAARGRTAEGPAPGGGPPHAVPSEQRAAQTILSFDVEEHFRIEAAAGLAVDPSLKAEYCGRVEGPTRWLLDQLEEFGVRATFYVVGKLARRHPSLVRAMARAGHEVGSHSWGHQRLHNLTPAAFREDLLKSRDVLEQITGQPVFGYRAPTFSVVRQTSWAIDILAEQGFAYDSSIYPVWHDRYGVPRAPRSPFRVRGATHEILELPPVTLRLLGMNLPVGGGGYFRLLPLFFMKWGLRQVQRTCDPAVAMLYFHPWEFDPEQPRLPLRRLRRFRTYVGISRTRGRLRSLLAGGHRFARAIDVAKRLDASWEMLPGFDLRA